MAHVSPSDGLDLGSMITGPQAFTAAVHRFHALEFYRLGAANLPDEVKSALLREEIPARVQLWERALRSASEGPGGLRILAEAASPYYLGFGNPRASILFMGQELAFDPVSRPDLLFHENLSNLVYWREIIARDLLSDPSLSLSRLPFSPLFPNAFHKVTNLNHTWGIYAKILAPVVGDGRGTPRDLLGEHVDCSRSLFWHCFTTELYDRPAKHHAFASLSRDREAVLADPFFRSFPVTIVGCASLLRKPRDVERIFDVTYSSELGGQNSRIPVSVFSAAGRSLFLTWQLSGANRPSAAFLSTLSAAVKEALATR